MTTLNEMLSTTMCPITIIDVEQGTQKWREIRARALTGSRMGAAIGAPGAFGNRKSLIREMVKEANGIFSDFSNEAMRWGTNNEDKARAVVEFETGLDFSDQKMRVYDRLGYSPDGVSACGQFLLEAKCPWSLRNDPAPEFKTLGEQRSYMAQIQFGMLMTGTVQCYFVQWTPYNNHTRIVERDPDWVFKNQDKIDSFFVELDEALASPEMVETLTSRQDDKWVVASTAYKRAKIAKEESEAVMNAAKDELIALAADDDAHGCGLKVAKVTRQGAVQYKKIPQLEGVDLDEYRGKASEYWSIKETKGS